MRKPMVDSGDPNTDKDNAGFKTLRVLSTLGALGLHSDGEVRLVDLVQATGYTRPTVHRLLATMKTCGFVTQTEAGLYRFGAQMELLAQQCYGTRDIRRMALPAMQALCRETGHTVHLGIRDGSDVAYVDKQEPPNGLHISSAIGQKRPLQFTALGKALLTWSPAGTAETLLPAAWAGRTANSLTTTAAVTGQFGDIRARGYAVDNEESDPGFRCVAAPILTRGGLAVAALSMTTSTARTSMDELRAMGLRIAETAGMISRLLQGNNDLPPPWNGPKATDRA